MIWSELNYIAICLCNKDPDFIFLLNRLSFFQCLLPWVPWQGIIQWIHSPVEKELSKSPVWLIDDGKELPEFILFIKVFVVTKEIPKNMVERITMDWIIPCLQSLLAELACLHAQKYRGSSPNIFYGLEAYVFILDIKFRFTCIESTLY